MENSNVERLIDNLRKKGFKAEYFPNAQLAKTRVLSEIGEGQSVGFGGSMTIYNMDIHKELDKKGNPIFWHWLVSPEERNTARAKAINADVYLSSTNAITVEGELVNIDGTGNRVSSMFFGPKKVIIVCGTNKITEDYESAISRIKSEACPPNAKRLNLDTPCAKTGKCFECYSKDRMCNVTVKIDRPTHGRDIHIFVVGESLGF